MSSAYLRLLIFLPAILIPACASSSPAFIMMYSAYKLNKPGDNIHPCCTPLPVWNQSVVPCPVVTVASWPAYRFLWYSYLFQNFPQFIVIHKVKGFGIVNKAEINVFLELKMGSIKNRNCMDLKEAEDFKKRWQEYTEELYKKYLHE